MTTVKEYLFSNPINLIIDLVESDTDSDVLKYKIAVYLLSGQHDHYFILSADDRITRIVEIQKKWTEISKTNDLVRSAIKSGAGHPCVYGNDDLKVFMEDVPTGV
jgi:hypothetical protein